MKLIQQSLSLVPSCSDPGVKLVVVVDRFRSVKNLVQGIVEGAELVARQLDDGFGTVSICLRELIVALISLMRPEASCSCDLRLAHGS